MMPKTKTVQYVFGIAGGRKTNIDLLNKPYLSFNTKVNISEQQIICSLWCVCKMGEESLDANYVSRIF